MPTYTGISSEAFRHPGDREAEQALRSVPGFELVARKFVEFVSERPQFVYHLSSSIQVGPRQYSTLYGIFRECVRDLDVYPEPSLFVTRNPLADAYALGKDNPYVVVSTDLLDSLDEAEIRAALANELGHIKCGHSILFQTGLWSIRVATAIGDMTMGLGNLIGSGLIFAFYEWLRYAELSADRAALLVMDDPQPVTSMMMKMAGVSQKYAHECSLDELIKQSEDCQNLDEDSLNQIYKFLLYNAAPGAMLTHPFPVERLSHLRRWAESAEYRQIRAGNYRRSESEGALEVESKSPQQEPRQKENPHQEPRQKENPQQKAEELRRQVRELQEQIDRIKSKK
ncbi:MAG: M48 family metalloprotease [Oscillatoria sp. SIO1A7]|nr:M48 family metalloprotease [Oscillatoria sp. SIO1A7]